ncbi:hypothetical protein LR48_Vigan03g122500 [Vigna angularis]|uniref:Uncharacterized protein n=1 Tax=Phaseolus angularis TaxID=3914 RepID=A0A0L9U4U4_PHAAN|nr:hypothetical protein LR48_Vigan03g122500 [Vigna angularis]
MNPKPLLTHQEASRHGCHLLHEALLTQQQHFVTQPLQPQNEAPPKNVYADEVRRRETTSMNETLPIRRMSVSV